MAPVWRGQRKGFANAVQETTQIKKLALYCCQRTIRNYIGKTWLWWTLVGYQAQPQVHTVLANKAEYEDKIAINGANIDKAILNVML